MKPEDTNLPDNILGQYFEIKFTSDSDIEITPLFNIEDHDITINDNIVSGKYNVNSSVTYKTVSSDFTKSEYNKFSDVPEDEEVYHFITSNKQKYTFMYKVTDDTEENIYKHEVFADWTILAKDFRSLL